MLVCVLVCVLPCVCLCGCVRAVCLGADRPITKDDDDDEPAAIFPRSWVAKASAADNDLAPSRSSVLESPYL